MCVRNEQLMIHTTNVACASMALMAVEVEALALRAFFLHRNLWSSDSMSCHHMLLT